MVPDPGGKGSRRLPSVPRPHRSDTQDRESRVHKARGESFAGANVQTRPRLPGHRRPHVPLCHHPPRGYNLSPSCHAQGPNLINKNSLEQAGSVPKRPCRSVRRHLRPAGTSTPTGPEHRAAPRRGVRLHCGATAGLLGTAECHHGWQGWCAHERAPSPVKHCHTPPRTESQGAVLRKAASECAHAQALVTCLPSPRWLMLCSTCTGDCHMRRGRDSASRRLRERSSS